MMNKNFVLIVLGCIFVSLFFAADQKEDTYIKVITNNIKSVIRSLDTPNAAVSEIFFSMNETEEKLLIKKQIDEMNEITAEINKKIDEISNIKSIEKVKSVGEGKAVEVSKHPDRIIETLKTQEGKFLQEYQDYLAKKTMEK